MKTLRRISLVLAMTLLLSVFPAFAAENHLLIPRKNVYPGFSDVADVWCEDAVKLCCETGILQGTSKTTFSPGGSLTDAQVIAIAARLHSLLHGGTGKFPAAAQNEDWWGPYEFYLNQQKIYVRDYLGGFTTPAQRHGTVLLLAKVLPEATLTPINSIAAIPDLVSAEALAFYRAGILTGMDAYGTFGMNVPLTRGQMAAILARIADPGQRVRFSAKPFDVSREILGVDGTCVVMTVNGLPVTAEDFGGFLLPALTFQGEQEAPDPMTSAKADVIACFALLSHAEDAAIALTAAETAAVAAQADTQAGYLGLSRDYYLRTLTRDALEAKLRAAMAIAHGENNADWQRNLQLTAWRDAAVVNVLPALETLKPAEIAARLSACPIAYVY
ncbi:MAG: S-layer homology domain-containing protein [Oscillibacter sp.]